MKYPKLPLSFEAQADQLIARGLIAERAILVERLKAVNYYRLSGYLYPFREPDDSFKVGTTLEAVWRRYTFDRRLRLLFIDAIERIEVAVRTRLVCQLAHHELPEEPHLKGAFCYLSSRYFPGFSSNAEYLKWRSGLAIETQRAKSEAFVQHFKDKYGDHHDDLPIWAVCELMTFGSMFTMAKTVVPEVREQVAAEFGFPSEHFLSWLQALMILRNACAHHSRVWNRESGKPAMPHKNKFPLWRVEPQIPNTRTGYLLTICYHWLGKISTSSNWRERLFTLLDEFPEIPLEPMGLPEDWKNHPLWKS